MAANTRTKTQGQTKRSAKLALDRKPSANIDLFFQSSDQLDRVDDPIWKDISALAVIGRSIFCTCDETSTVERIVLDPETGQAGDHVNFVLGETFDLPDGPAGEMDIEGLAIADGYLWICGSHSLKRDDPEDNGLKDMEDIDWDPNRAFLGKVPLVAGEDGIYDIYGAFEPLDDTPAEQARMLKLKKKRKKSPIYKLLAEDPLIGPFIDLPCKENGLDIEGLAVHGDTVLLGLRGPVIGSHALIVRLKMKTVKNDCLKPRKLDNGPRYSLQALDLDGQAIRDLHWDGDRLLILTGATTDLEALQSVLAIDDYDPARDVYARDTLRDVLHLPALRGADHAEGMAPIQIDNQEKLLLAYDSPHADRTSASERCLTADVFDLHRQAPNKTKKRSPRETQKTAGRAI